MNATEKWLLLGNLAWAGYLTGLIWYVQWVHYPIFARAQTDFALFHRAHTSTTGQVVMVPMLAELALALALVIYAGQRIPTGWAWVALGLVLLVWAVTFFISVPLHNQLSHGYDEAAARRLVQTNWLRTIAWTARFGILLYVVSRQL
ncbi:DUF1772 domain-containing protein [Catalinimonas alkaloidigena]|nr:DUF1772 domain-containing protein [Catalinimonas alkaloidigena]